LASRHKPRALNGVFMFGLFTSWLARWFSRPKRGIAWPASRSAAAQAPAPALSQASDNREQAIELMGRATTLTSSVADQVGEHSGSLCAINTELAGVQQGDTTAVAGAIRKLLQSNEAMQRRLALAELQLLAHQRQLRNVASAARTDGLTGLLNRRTLDEELNRCLADFRRRGRPSALLMVDVDQFKRFNDQHGHVVGDVVLKHVAEVLLSHSRDTDIVARFGGEEFAVVLLGATASAVRKRAEQARSAIGQTIVEVEGQQLRVTASAGLAETTDHDTVVSFLARADAAMYAAKHGGRDCGYWHDGQQIVRLTGATLEPAVAAGEPAASDQQRQAVELAAEQFADSTFVANIARRIAEWRRGGATFSIVLGRLEGTEMLPGDDGERACHEALRMICKSAPAFLRDMDLTTRWMSDGIAILLPGAPANEAVRVARRLRSGLENHEVQVKNHAIKLRMNLGVAEGIEGNDAHRVLGRAWEAAMAGADSSVGVHLHDGVRVRPCPVANAAR
jgi:diguanylate cyclase